VILTQTLQLIYDLRSAIATVHRILKPGGVVLVTVPGITPVNRQDSESWGNHWCWSFTALSARRLFEEHFRAEHVHVETHGNVLAAASFLYGLGRERADAHELDHRDPDYEMVITLRAQKELPLDPVHGSSRSGDGLDRMLHARRTRRGAALPPHRRRGQSDPYGLCVPPAQFEEHLMVIREVGRPMRLTDFAAALRNRSLPDRAIAITFDDGYIDNLECAAPLLARHDVPGLVFVTTGAGGRDARVLVG
jgi:hypothetical protein